MEKDLKKVPVLFEYDEFYSLLGIKIFTDYQIVNNNLFDNETGTIYNSIRNINEINDNHFWSYINFNLLKTEIQKDIKLNDALLNALYAFNLFLNENGNIIIKEELAISSNDFSLENSFINQVNDIKKLPSFQMDIRATKISEVYDEVRKAIKGQDKQIKEILTHIYQHYLFGLKSNLLLAGPSGTGKTATIDVISNIINKPFISINMGIITSPGYVGENIESMFESLYERYDNNINSVENSIVFLDEIDKKANGNSNEESKMGVINALLKLTDKKGHNVRLYINNSRKEDLVINTQNIFFIAAGAFSDMQNNKNKSLIGFNRANEFEDESYQISDFIKYGLSKEFMGRFSTIIKFNELSTDVYLDILKNSNQSPLKVLIDKLKLIDSSIKVPYSVYEALISKVNSGIGFRELFGIVNKLFVELMFDLHDIPNKNGIKLDIEGIEEVDNNLKLKYNIDGQRIRRFNVSSE